MAPKVCYIKIKNNFQMFHSVRLSVYFGNIFMYANITSLFAHILK